MKLIKPSEISGRILTLLDESDQWVIIVSPYMKISSWHKLLNRLNAAKSRNIRIEIYVRANQDNNNTFNDLNKLNLPYRRIPNLHCKLYMNEKQGILTSMNLLVSSEINSLEAGVITENLIEYNELKAYYHRYIENCKHPCQGEEQPTAYQKVFKRCICDELRQSDKNSWLIYGENQLCINTVKNSYRVSILKGHMKISVSLRYRKTTGIDSGEEKKSTLLVSSQAKKIRDNTGLLIEMYDKPDSNYYQICGQTIHKLKSKSILNILEDESTYLLECIRSFVITTDEL